MVLIDVELNIVKVNLSLKNLYICIPEQNRHKPTKNEKTILFNRINCCNKS